MGSMIGSGIFIVPAAMSRELGSPLWLMIAWVATGVLTLLAALNYGELSAMLPKAGGQYIYLKEAYNRLFGFLYGWTLFTVIQTGTIAAVAVAFAKFTGVLFPSISDQNFLINIGFLHISTQQALAITVIWALTVFNFRPVKSGALLQNFFTLTKIGAILFMIGSAIYFCFTQGSKPIDWSVGNSLTTSGFWSIFSVALVGSIFSTDAWNNVTFPGGEIHKPERTLPLSLVTGTGLVLIIYLLMNWMYLLVLPFEEIQHADKDRVGTALLSAVFGEGGLIIMAVLIMISTFGCINGITLSGARVYYAMAQDGLFFTQAKTLNKNHSPQTALIFQAIWTSILALSGSYGDLLDYVVFAVLLFYILTVAGVIILRFKRPNENRPYKVPAYPIVPILYILLAGFVCINLLLFKPDYTFPGLGIVLLGIPVYFLVNRKSQNR